MITVEKLSLQQMTEYFKTAPEKTRKAIMLAVNQGVDRKGRPGIRKVIESEVNFPKGYLDEPQRLWVSRRATESDLRATISARSRATMLARFATGKLNQNGVVVKVKRGGTGVSMERAFLLRLKNNNIGLAMRLPAGKKPENAHKPTKVRGRSSKTDLWLLYGPSVDQMMINSADEITPSLMSYIENEFYRQFARLS